jgi:hypothetical protein
MAVTFKVELKEGVKIDELVNGLKKGAKENDIDFKGDNKSGEAKKSGAKVKYDVSGNTVTITCESNFPASLKYSDDDLKKMVLKWLKPYIK